MRRRQVVAFRIVCEGAVVGEDECAGGRRPKGRVAVVSFTVGDDLWLSPREAGIA